MHPGGGGALLHEPGVVNDQYAALSAELFGDVGLQVVTDLVRVPAGAGEQVLQAVGGGVAGLLGQLPAVFAGHRGEQAADVVTHAAAWFDAAEAVPDVGEQVVEVSVPGLGCECGHGAHRR